MTHRLESLRQIRHESPRNRPAVVSTPTLKHVQIVDKDSSFSPLLREKPGRNMSYRKIESEIINELLKSKLKRKVPHSGQKIF